jgi:hypothetical protein
LSNLKLSTLNDGTGDNALHDQERRIKVTLADIFGADSLE